MLKFYLRLKFTILSRSKFYLSRKFIAISGRNLIVSEISNQNLNKKDFSHITKTPKFKKSKSQKRTSLKFESFQTKSAFNNRNEFIVLSSQKRPFESAWERTFSQQSVIISHLFVEFPLATSSTKQKSKQFLKGVFGFWGILWKILRGNKRSERLVSFERLRIKCLRREWNLKSREYMGFLWIFYIF
jgi:hypothetical protein